MEALILQIIVVLTLAIFGVAKPWKFWVGYVLHLGIAIITSYWAISVLAFDQKIKQTLYIPNWYGGIALWVDNLSAFFIIIINFTILTGTLYGSGYLKPYHKTKSNMHLSLHHFYLVWLQMALLMLVMVDDGFAFLFWWEVMSLTAFILVIFQAEQRSVMENGLNYLIQTHLGFLFILVGFLSVSSLSGGKIAFSSLQKIFAEQPNFPLFLLFFIGFAFKAGFVPFHTWLPRAHPSAPSHISGIMSGVIIKIGIYGILRVLTFVQKDFLAIGLTIFMIGTISGLVGVMLAVFQKDMKKLLAFSSIENIGIIGMGIGLAVLGKATNSELLMFLGMTGGILHILNHALMKPLLFYSAGNVYYATHTRDLNRLGGLTKSMPQTSLFFLLGILAICGIPPFNGFISEFLLYCAGFQNLAHADFNMSFLSLGLILSLALISGFALFAFTKLFGIAFLGNRRDLDYHKPKEVPFAMRFSNWLIVIMIMAVGFFPVFFMNIVEKVILVFPQFKVDNSFFIKTNQILSYIGIIDLTFALILGILLGLRYWQQRKITIAYDATWGCGYTGGDFKHQYTATSYADSASILLVKPVVKYRKPKIEYSEDEIFPKDRLFITKTEDRIERKIILLPIKGMLWGLTKAGLAQTGRIQDYLIYPVVFIILLGIMTMMGWI